MSCARIKFRFKTLTKPFTSCSLVNADGALLFSKDRGLISLATTRLVAFQIVKKYLAPQPGDLFILNDPENGGYQFAKLIFIAALTPNLFLIWDEDYAAVEFKIPPTPLFDRGLRNEFVWKALVETHPEAADFARFIHEQKKKIDHLAQQKQLLSDLSDAKTQSSWFDSAKEAFEILFNNKAQGSIECSYKIGSTQQIKLKLTAEEKQNIKMFTLDLTNTSLASDLHCSSHVAESSILKCLVEYYQFDDYFSQPILDKIKMILPPRSVVSKPHPDGAFNVELQAVCRQLCAHVLTQLNSPGRKPQTQFDYSDLLSFQIRAGNRFFENYISGSEFNLKGFESLIESRDFEVLKMRRHENSGSLAVRISKDSEILLTIRNNYDAKKSHFKFKLNGNVLQRGCSKISAGDTLELDWQA